MDRIATEIRLEVVLGFEQYDTDTSTCEQECEDAAAGAAADDRTVGVVYRGQSQPKAPAVRSA